MTKKRIKIKQHDITDCGAACLASICAYYGLRFPVARIRQYAYTDKKGTNILGLIEAANRLGLRARGVRAKFEALEIVPKPTIAHVIVHEHFQHYIVVYEVNKKYIVYMDPADGAMHKVTLDDFKMMWTGVLVLLEPDEQFQKGNYQQGMVSRFFSLLMPHKSMMLQAIFGAFIFSILGLSMSIFVGKITDYVLVDKNLNLLHLMGVAMLLILVLRTYIGAMKSILALKTGQRIDATLILGYYKHLLHLPQQFFDTMRTGEIISRVNDAVKIRNFINNVSLDLVVNSMMLLFSVCLMLVYSWQLALVSMVAAPLFALIFWGYNKLNKKYQRKIMESSADLESQLVESVNAIGTIKRFGIEDYANLKTETRFVHLLRHTYHSIFGTIMTQGCIQFVSTGVTIAILWIGSILVVHQEMTPGILMVFYSLIGYVISPIGILISSNQVIQDALIAADRLFQIMDLELEQNKNDKIVLEKDMIGDIVFDNVCFRYGSRKDVFQDLSLCIEQGKTTAILGESGSGKTTLISLLQHIYSIQSGHIHIGSFDISQIENSSLRRLIGVVPQQIELFAGTILDNIALGDLQPDMKRIVLLTEQLGLKDFIDKLPQGYMTHIGEHGVSLSGGERQRIAIARSLYKEPEILIFDEATSSLDSMSERYVKRTLVDLTAKGKTIIIIAHRLSTVKDADAMIVLNHGKVAEKGTHQTLCDSGGIYSRLWHEQFDLID